MAAQEGVPAIEEEFVWTEGCEEELVIDASQKQQSNSMLKRGLLQQGRDLAREEQCAFMSTSARTGHNIIEAF